MRGRPEIQGIVNNTVKLPKWSTLARWSLLVLPTLIFYCGFTMNQWCIMHNGYQMPVRMANCTEFMRSKAHQSITDPDQEFKLQDDGSDPVHVCESSSTRYMWLGDVFVTDGGVMSLGDLVMSFGDSATYVGFGLWFLLTLDTYWLQRKYGVTVPKA